MAQTNQRGQKTILYYAIPAYGHIHSNLRLFGYLAEHGYRVCYYATETFRAEIEANGCEFRAYPFRQEELDLTDGKRLPKLYLLLLRYTESMLPVLLKEAEAENARAEIAAAGSVRAVIYDSLAPWGRAIGELLSVRTFSCYSIVALGRMGGRAFWAYGLGFLPELLRHGRAFFDAIPVRHRLRRKYGLHGLDFCQVLMNRGTWNLMGYSRRFQPDGDTFGKDYLFAGAASAYRRLPQRPETETGENLPDDCIYISMGSILSQDPQLLRQVLLQFCGREKAVQPALPGAGREKPRLSSCPIIIIGDSAQVEVCRKELGMGPEIWKQIRVFPFADQMQVLKRTRLFITAGGMNSIHEALYCGVPCLLYPQQGEQKINARQFEKLGFGKILTDPGRLLQEAQEAVKLKESWSEELRGEVLKTDMEAVLRVLDGRCE